MRYPLTHDHETNRYHRARAMGGAVILFTLAAGFVTLGLFGPTPPEHLSVNCHDVQLGTGLSDAAPDLTGCVPARPASAQRERTVRQPAGPLPAVTPEQFSAMKPHDPATPTF